jgi:hypothetical protein
MLIIEAPKLNAIVEDALPVYVHAPVHTIVEAFVAISTVEVPSEVGANVIAVVVNPFALNCFVVALQSITNASIDLLPKSIAEVPATNPPSVKVPVPLE